MEQFLEFVIRRLVEFPDEVLVTSSEQGRRIVLKVKLRQSDAGKVIGRNGHVIEAIRHLVNAAASRHQRRAMVEILE